jgi:hypothetical protein
MKHSRFRVMPRTDGRSLSRRDVLLGGAQALSVLALPQFVVPKAWAQTTSSTFDYYISPSGSDSNAGTQASPWAITSINTKQSTYAGKRVGLLSGTYSLSGLYNAGDYSIPALSIAPGTASNPTVIAAVTPRQAILDGGGSATNSQGCGMIGSTSSGGYITIDGLTITNGYGPGIYFQYTNSLSDSTPRIPGCVIQNCEVYNINSAGAPGGTNHAGIMVFNMNGMLVHNCYIHDIFGETSTNDHCSCIEMWVSANCTVEYCTLLNSFAGVHGKNSGNRNLTVRYCYIDLTAYPNPLTCAFDYDDNTYVGAVSAFYNNVAKANAPFARDLFTSTVGTTTFYNNTFISNTGTLECLTAPGGVVNVYNNIMTATSASYRGYLELNQGGFGTVNYNCYPSPATLTSNNAGNYGSPDNTYNSLAAWQSATKLDTNSFANNSPGFVATGTYAAYYQLSSGSVCKGVGRSNGLSSGSACDLGAWGNGATSIGCNFVGSGVVTGTAIPDAPQLSVS